ncbi:hypothetical protein EUTSA_v10003391mg [Eutrema salsugineum]|uniref:F-box domain-containing protein n=1 Tax=Eutrema salsugineum TaxID=72664 RepID=V4LQI1_EUTSA|nr:F-box/kelch-repeat protein At3g04660 [Eutrema salsugineum]ESQ44747.1 hypothetical protein EUTSA_v10003391mg [Eutrema salsugineum]
MKRVTTTRKLTTGNKSMKRDDVKDYSLSLPVDLIIQILTKLPPRSVSKLICLSKFWSSIIQGKHFAHLYITRSSTRPLLLFQFFCRATQFYRCSSQENPSSDHIINPKNIPGHIISTPFRGLICVRDYDNKLLVGNPSTGQFLALPGGQTGSILFGYDPVTDLYKVLSTSTRKDVQHRVFTLGAQQAWRSIHCKYPHYCTRSQGICKNGVVYYGAYSLDDERFVLVCFDLRFEEFSLITLPEGVQIKRDDDFEIVNYNGKIALVDDSTNGKFDLWVLMDVNKQEWTNISVLVPCWEELVGNTVFGNNLKFCCRGTISTGELIFGPCFYPYRYFIVCYDPKEDKARRYDFLENCSVEFITRKTIFLDHVESPMFLPRCLSV